MRLCPVAVLVVCLGATTPLAAQSGPELPQLSSSAEVSQTVGITELSITYSSPARRDREIWGGLVPYGELWRAGANAPTRLSVEHDFSFGGTDVPAGEYSLFIMPEEDAFTFILNTDPLMEGYGSHDPSLDVAQAEVEPTDGPDRERMLFVFDGSTDESTELTLEWAGLAASVTIEVDTPVIALEGINASLDQAWRPHFNSARYYLNTGQDLAQAEEWMAGSIAIQENWWNHWFMAEILAEQDEYERAREHAERAMELGEDDDLWQRVFLPQAEQALTDWPDS